MKLEGIKNVSEITSCEWTKSWLGKDWLVLFSFCLPCSEKYYFVFKSQTFQIVRLKLDICFFLHIYAGLLFEFLPYIARSCTFLISLILLDSKTFSFHCSCCLSLTFNCIGEVFPGIPFLFESCYSVKFKFWRIRNNPCSY